MLRAPFALEKMRYDAKSGMVRMARICKPLGWGSEDAVPVNLDGEPFWFSCAVRSRP
jgi:hypothetical protein